MEESNDNMYSQIIFKSPNDQDLQDILSYKAKSLSPRRFKKWSPEISNEERTLKKKEREDEYIQKIIPDERPILLVKKKQKFENLNNPNLIGSIPSEDNKLKIIRQTELLVDVDEDIRRNSPQIKRQTVYHKNNPNAKSQPVPGKQNITKVDGVEYLPEGFLELDPLLMKDDYQFDNKVMEEMFREEQRKLKALRRKQYTEKNYQKKRDVTIYVIEDYKDRVIEFMDLWFEKYKKKMTPEELQEVANKLETSYENLKRLQELYLKRKRLLKSKEMKQNAKPNGKDWSQYEQVALTPNQIKEYYKKQNKFGHVESKVKQDPLGHSKWKYNPFFIEKYNQKRNKSQPLRGAYSVKSISRNGSPLTKSQKSKKAQELKRQLKAEKDDNSVDNTFYMLSRTNNEGENLTDKGSWVANPNKGKYDHLVDDFNKLVSGDTKPNNHFWVNVNGQKRKSTKYCSNVCRKHCPHGSHPEDNHHHHPQSQYHQQAPVEPRVQQQYIPTNEAEMYNQMIDSQVQNPKPSELNDPMETNFYSDLGNYFDKEINVVLKKIKGYKVEGVTDCEVNVGDDHKLMNCSGSLQKQTELQNEMIENMVKPETNVNVNEMFHEKDINDLKNRIKSQTSGDVYKNMVSESDPLRKQTYHNKFFEDQKQIEPEIEALKRQTISNSMTPKHSVVSSKSQKNFENELLSRNNLDDVNRDSGNSENFSFNPRAYNNNVKSQMNEVMDNFADVPPVKKNITVSLVMDGLEERNLEDVQHLRDKANSMAHQNNASHKNRANTVLVKENEQRKIETVNEAHSSDFEDPNDNDLDSEMANSRHQSENGEGNSLNHSNLRQKANTMMHKDYSNQKNSELIKSRADSINSLSRSKTPSILSQGGKKRLTKKRVTFCELKPLQEEQEEIDFIKKVPTGSVQLNREQREKLIEVLENQEKEGEDDDDDIILTLNQDQVLGVVNNNFGEDNVKVALDSFHLDLLKEKVNPEESRKISIYPKNFFAMIEKQKLKGSRMSVYPKEFFDGLNESGPISRRSMKENREKAISIYPKDLFDIVEKALDKGEINAYPQEIFDLLQAFGEYEINPTTREKAQSIYPSEFLNLAEKQAERKRDRTKTVFPKQLFELSEQEKVNGNRVSVYPKDLLNLIEKEARNRGVSVYPGDFFNMLDKDYSNIIQLNPEQIQTVVKANSGERNTQIVLSSEQRKTLLQNLKEHRDKEEEIMNELNINKNDSENFVLNEDMIEIPVLHLEKDQVMDILNQNCLMNGAEISLTESQINLLEQPNTVRNTVIGTSYYDAMVDELVDDTGNRITLSKMSLRDRKSMLSQLSHKNFSILVTGENAESPPTLIENAYYNVEKDAIENPLTNEVIEIGLLDQNERSKELNRISTINHSPSPTVLMGHAYYDALVDQIVDQDGNRHSLKNMSLLDVKKFADDEQCKRISVVVQPNEEQALILENVTYLPVEDCLLDEKNNKTDLSDLNDEQRVIFLQALSKRRGSLLPSEAAYRKSKLMDKGGFAELIDERQFEEEDDQEDFQDEQSVKTDDYQINIQKASMSKLDPKEKQQREELRRRQKTSFQNNPDSLAKKQKELSKEEKEKLLPESDNVRYRGSVGFKIKNYSGGARKKANTIHPKAKKNQDKLKSVEDLHKSESQNSMKSDSRKGKKIGPSRISNLRKKKKSTNMRKSNVSKLSEKDKNKQIEEQYLQNVNSGQNANEADIITESVVVENIVRGSKSSLMNKLLGDDRDPINKRHTVSGKKSDKEDGRLKAKTVLGKEFKKKSILTESNGSEELQNDQIQENDMEVIETVPLVQPEEAEYVDFENKSESKKESLSNSEKLKKFNELEKEQLPISKGGRRTFVAKRKKKASNERKRGNTFANKYISDDKIDEVNEDEASQKDIKFLEYNHQSTPPKMDKFDNEVYKHFSHEPNNLQMGDSTKQMSNQSPPDHTKLKFTEEGNVSGISDEALKERIKEVFKQEKNRFSDDLFSQCRDYIDSRGSPKRRQDSDIMEEFYEFCKHKLPTDEKYKESIMYVSLFYYFMEKRKFLG